MSHIASFIGICRARRCSAPPPSAASPTLGSGKPNSAWSDATARSQAATISAPPPRHRPFTAAITGFHRSKRVVMPAKPPGRILVRAGRRQRLEVGAHAEGAIAGGGDDGHAQRRIGGVEIERAIELEVRVPMQRIEHLGAIDRDRQDRVLALEPQVVKGGRGRRIGHGIEGPRCMAPVRSESAPALRRCGTARAGLHSVRRAPAGEIEDETGGEAAFGTRDPRHHRGDLGDLAGSGSSVSWPGRWRCAPPSSP